MKSFIEKQFPEDILSEESVKERMAGSGQTLTGLGKWWGRKPLVLVRAVLLGCLLPATEDPKRDREIFLKLMTMDHAGLLKRKKSSVTLAQIVATLSAAEQEKFFTQESKGKWQWKEGLSREEKKEIETKAFFKLSYEERLRYCLRPEEIEGPDDQEWAVINAYLGTHASSLRELVEELGQKRFGRTPHVGDVFCGGGSIPFEAARLGCQVHASDLNPVACLLTWGALKLLDTGEEEAVQLAQAEEELQRDIEEQITAWGIEHNSQGWRADAFLYCIEAPCPECQWKVPMAPSWVISQKQRIICSLIPNQTSRTFNFEIKEASSEEEFQQASKGTVGNQKLHCPHCHSSIAISTVRGDRKGANGTESNLRRWEKTDFQPRPDDLYQERLYCIRWVVPADNKGGKFKRLYAAPTEEDLQREEKVVALLSERFHEWQEAGFIPSRLIEPGDKTDEPIRTRGWTHWHHLFNPRQLLKLAVKFSTAFRCEHADIILQITKSTDYFNKLCRWHTSCEKINNNFSNQALNVYWNYGCKTELAKIEITKQEKILKQCQVDLNDARQVKHPLDIIITDPPYADAVNYDELSEFFLAWLEPHLKKHFPDWYTDSKRALAIRGNGESFNKSMVACYRNLTEQMPDNGMQVIFFAHTNKQIIENFLKIIQNSNLKIIKKWRVYDMGVKSISKGKFLRYTNIFICRKNYD